MSAIYAAKAFEPEYDIEISERKVEMPELMDLDAGNAFRGILIGIPISLLLWAGILAVVF